MHPALGEGDGTGDTLTGYAQAQHPARQRGPSKLYKLGCGIALQPENQIFKGKFPLRGADPLTAQCCRDRGQGPTRSGQWESCGLPVSLRTSSSNWADSKLWGCTFFHFSILFRFLLGECPHLENV